MNEEDYEVDEAHEADLREERRVQLEADGPYDEDFGEFEDSEYWDEE